MLVDAKPTRRRITDLTGLGYTYQQIGAAANRPAGVIEALAASRDLLRVNRPGLKQITRRTAKAIERADRRLFYDWVVVQRLINGEPLTAEPSNADRRQAVRRLDAAGMPRHRICKHLGIPPRQVYRDLGLAA